MYLPAGLLMRKLHVRRRRFTKNPNDAVLLTLRLNLSVLQDTLTMYWACSRLAKT